MRYRDRLPQLDDGGLFLTDGGIETVLIFHEGLELPAFAAFDRAAAAAGLPAAISFTLETDGRLPSGQALGDAIRQVDADTPPAYYMINCAHPTHFEQVLDAGASWAERIRGLRANASTLSHAELDEATELDEGDPADLGARYAGLRAGLPRLTVLGGCCGTDHRHVAAIRDAWLTFGK